MPELRGHAERASIYRMYESAGYADISEEESGNHVLFLVSPDLPEEIKLSELTTLNSSMSLSKRLYVCHFTLYAMFDPLLVAGTGNMI